MPKKVTIDELVEEIVEKDFDEDKVIELAQKISDAGIDYKKLYNLVLKKIDEKKAKGDYK